MKKALWLVGAGLMLMVLALALMLVKLRPLMDCPKARTAGEVRACLGRLDAEKEGLAGIAKVFKITELKEVLWLLEQGRDFLPDLEYLLGENGQTTYMVLLQNDMELRATGGFVGSYAMVSMERGEVGIKFQDIYVPDGQVTGYIKPPGPVQEAFQLGEWRMRDWDWSPDFKKGADVLRWFMQQGGEVEADIVVTLNLSTIEKIMAVVGEIQVDEYDLTLNEENIYQVLQSESEVDFFPGSTQKKDALTAVGKALFEEIESLDWRKKLKIAVILFQNLNNQNILLNSKDEQAQRIWENKDWAGVFTPVDCAEPAGCLPVTMAMIEANLGANKANCCVEKSSVLEISKKDNRLIHEIKVEFKNNSALEHPKKPVFYGGNYISYLRFYIPIGAENIEVWTKPTLPRELVIFPEPYEQPDRGKLSINNRYGFTEVGFFHTTRAGTTSVVQLRYELPYLEETSYQLTILKQHGTKEFEQKINIFGEQVDSTLLDDLTLVRAI